MSIVIQITPPTGDPIVLDPIGAEGAIGSNGWTPVLALAPDNARRVLQVIDWAGGQGTKPAVGEYVGAGSTLVTDITQAVDIRGAQGVQGPQGDPGQIVTSGGIFTGDGPPNDSDHVDGDIYINNLNADLYQKQTGHWVLQTNIRGGKGDKGDAGDPGTPGIAGTNGATILIGTGAPSGGLGAVGDIYIESASFTLYQKSGVSTWTTFGTFRGPAGNSIRVAAGAPSNSLGADGDSYINSANGDLYLRSTGTYTIAGNLKGPSGSQGTQGIQGPTGASTLFGSADPSSGVGSNGDSFINTTSFHLFTKSAGAWSDAGTLKGANGVNGIGNAIYTGPSVPGTIPPSIDGDIFINTSTGDVYQRVGGDWGSPLMNMRGPQGTQGAQGVQGNPGNTGAAGFSFLSGAGAPSGALGNNGDSYLNTTSGDVYGPKASGAWPSASGNIKGPQGNTGSQGIQGNAGTNGTNGSNFLSGAGAPASGLGANGDTYLNVTTGDLYGPKSAGAWGSIAGSLKGPQGIQGIQGIQGNQGNTGTRGAVWYTGSTVPGAQTGQLAGDIYLRSTTGEIYTATSPTAWSDAGFSIQGPQGTQGIQGTTGPAGPSNLPQNSQSANYTTVIGDVGKHIFHPAADTTARTFTIDHSLAYAIGDSISFINENGAGVLSIAISGGTSPTLRLAGATSTGTRTLAANGVATAVKVSASTWYASGVGLT